jgi:hypothetical protein
VVIWYIFPILVFCTKKNLATLVSTSKAAALFVALNQKMNQNYFKLEKNF